MNQRTVSRIFVACFAGIILTGCMPKMTIEDMKAMMPQRPVELDKLNAFVGHWEWTGEVTMAGLDRTLTFSGKSDAKWEGDGWYLVSQEVGNMEELGETQAMATWVYDARGRKFRTSWVDSMGAIGTGTARHDEKTNTWHMRAGSHGPSGKTIGKGTVKFLDDNTMEWVWTEYALGGLIKTMEMTGTSKRR